MLTLIAVSIYTGLTVLLWGNSSKQLVISRDVEERQLRAYVNVLTAEFANIGVGEFPKAILKFKNFGQTPAYHEHHWQFVKIAEYPLPGAVPFEADNGKHPKAPLAPSDTINAFAIWDKQPLNQATIDALKAKTHAMYVIGMIKYDDAFGRPRTTTYCFYLGGPIGLTDGTVAIYKDGNDSD